MKTSATMLTVGAAAFILWAALTVVIVRSAWTVLVKGPARA